MLISTRILIGIARWNNSQNYWYGVRKNTEDRISKKYRLRIRLFAMQHSRFSASDYLRSMNIENSQRLRALAIRVRTDIRLAFDKTYLDGVPDKLGGAFHAE